MKKRKNKRNGKFSWKVVSFHHAPYSTATHTSDLDIIKRRKELVKTVKKYTEEAKVQIRNARRDAIDKYKAMKKDGEITEDDLKETEKDIQDLTDKYIKEIDNISAAKEKEILEV